MVPAGRFVSDRISENGNQYCPPVLNKSQNQKGSDQHPDPALSEIPVPLSLFS